MYKAAKMVNELDATPHPHEAEIVEAFKGTALDNEQVKEARAAGMSWRNIVEVLAEFGPQFLGVLQAILVALKTKPPEQAKAEAVKQDEKAKPEDKPAEKPLVIAPQHHPKDQREEHRHGKGEALPPGKSEAEIKGVIQQGKK